MTDNVGRWMVFGGLALVTAGLVFGLAFIYFVDHEARLVEYDAYRPTLELITRGAQEETWRAELERTSEHALQHRHGSRVHAHAINMGILLILIGLFAPLVSDGQARTRRLIASAIFFAWLYPVGLLLQLYELRQPGQIVAALGAAGSILTLGLVFLKISKAVDADAKQSP